MTLIKTTQEQLEFIEMMTAKMSDKDTREDLKKVFDLFIGDDEKADKIELKHLKRVAKELNEMITRADTEKFHSMSSITS